VNLIQLIRRVLSTAIDILIIAAFIGLVLLLIRLAKAAWPNPTSRRFWLLERFAKKEGFEIDSALKGLFEIISTRSYFNESYEKLFYSPDVPVGLKGGLIILPRQVKSIIYPSFPDFPDEVPKFVLSRIKELIPIAAKNQKPKLRYFTWAPTQTVTVGCVLNREWTDSDTKATFDPFCVSLKVFGISYELVCLLAADLMKAFGQHAVLVKGAEVRGLQVIRMIHRNSKKRK
jgi:hypothetical protein